jgi:hypothetical protein
MAFVIKLPEEVEKFIEKKSNDAFMSKVKYIQKLLTDLMIKENTAMGRKGKDWR